MQETEEWNDYEDNKQADLTGLKIQKLTVDSEEERVRIALQALPRKFIM